MWRGRSWRLDPRRPDMDTTRLGMTELEVSRIAFGTWQIGGEWGEFDRDEAIAAIRHARDVGINLFDTAQAYGFGASERLLGEALRDDLDHIDLYQVHWPDPETPFADTAGALQELVDQGKIRRVGVSNYDADEMAEFARTRPVETLQPLYNLFQREVEDGTLPYARDNDIGVLAYSPLAHGLLTGAMDRDTSFGPGDWRTLSPLFKGETFRRNLEIVDELQRFAADEVGCSVSQLAIAWTLANPAVHVAIVGSRRAAHIEDSVGAAGVTLSEDHVARIEEIVSGAPQAKGPHP